MHFDYSHEPLNIRTDIAEAHRQFWSTLAAPGSWWGGAERVAIAQESRNALTCSLCKERKAALSPNAITGAHGSTTTLPALAVDAVHRIITDQSRITQTYVNDNAENGLSKEAYVELVGVVVATFSIDEFHRALGMGVEPLPSPVEGVPDGYRPAVLSQDMGFVPTIPLQGAVGNEADLYPPERAPNVLRALSLVPNALRDWFALSGAQYLSMQGMQSFAKQDSRAIDRMQMELVAGRVSAVNECFY